LRIEFRDGYILVYDFLNNRFKWAYMFLTPDCLKKGPPYRPPTKDPYLPIQHQMNRADTENLEEPYECGHGLGRQNIGQDIKTLHENNFYSNTAPQHQILNRGYYLKCENAIRLLTMVKDLRYLVCTAG